MVLRCSSRGVVTLAGAWARFPIHDARVQCDANGVPSQFEHFIAYAGSAAIATLGYGASQGSIQIIGAYWIYAGILEYLQRFSPGRHPSIADFAASALGALGGGLAVALLWRPSGQLG